MLLYSIVFDKKNEGIQIQVVIPFSGTMLNHNTRTIKIRKTLEELDDSSIAILVDSDGRVVDMERDRQLIQFEIS